MTASRLRLVDMHSTHPGRDVVMADGKTPGVVRGSDAVLLFLM